MAYTATASGMQAEQQQPEQQQRPEQSQEPEQSQQLLEQPSVLELLMSQQSQLQTGIKLTFSNDLKKEIAFDKTPYHYCAASGNTDLAAYLYSLGVPFDQDITVATFSADGKESRTPWNKALAISPVDTARMAGHAKAAEVLELVHAGVPLHWNRASHHMYPATFKKQAKQRMEALVSCSFIARLPGSARVQIVDISMTKLVQELVWHNLSPEVWKQQWKECAGEGYEQAQQLLQPAQTEAQEAPQQAGQDADLASYQFQIHDRRQRGPSPALWALRGACGVIVGLAAVAEAEEWGPPNAFINAGVFFAGVCKPLSTTLLMYMTAIMRHRSRMQRR